MYRDNCKTKLTITPLGAYFIGEKHYLIVRTGGPYDDLSY